eukprot:2455080-Rhodomonas_salina.1
MDGYFAIDILSLNPYSSPKEDPRWWSVFYGTLKTCERMPCARLGVARTDTAVQWRQVPVRRVRVDPAEAAFRRGAHQRRRGQDHREAGGLRALALAHPQSEELREGRAGAGDVAGAA